MHESGMHVPEAICISTEAYQEYVSSTGLLAQMYMELFRKPFEEMRWEEIWDTALRIRNMFIKTPLPGGLQQELKALLALRFPRSRFQSGPRPPEKTLKKHPSQVSTSPLSISKAWNPSWSTSDSCGPPCGPTGLFSIGRSWASTWRKAPWRSSSRRWSSGNAQGSSSA